MVTILFLMKMALKLNKGMKMKFSGRLSLTITRPTGDSYQLNFRRWDDMVKTMKKLRLSKVKPVNFKISFGG